MLNYKQYKHKAPSSFNSTWDKKQHSLTANNVVTLSQKNIHTWSAGQQGQMQIIQK